jgi:hypothetical protein
MTLTRLRQARPVHHAHVQRLSRPEATLSHWHGHMSVLRVQRVRTRTEHRDAPVPRRSVRHGVRLIARTDLAPARKVQGDEPSSYEPQRCRRGRSAPFGAAVLRFVQIVSSFDCSRLGALRLIVDWGAVSHSPGEHNPLGPRGSCSRTSGLFYGDTLPWRN